MIIIKKNYILAVLNDHFVFFNTDTKTKTDIKLPFEILPYTPFYHYLFESDIDKQQSFKAIIFDKLGFKPSQLNPFEQRKLFILMPDDILEIDKKILSEYFIMSRWRVSLCTQNLLCMQNSSLNYICISKTSRVYVMSHIENGSVKSKKFYDVNNIQPENILEEIKIHYDNNLPVFINNINGDNIFNNLGTNIYFDDILNNCMLLNKF